MAIPAILAPLVMALPSPHSHSSKRLELSHSSFQMPWHCHLTELGRPRLDAARRQGAVPRQIPRLQMQLKADYHIQETASQEISLWVCSDTNITFPDTPKRPSNALFLSRIEEFYPAQPFGFKKFLFHFFIFCSFCPHGAGGRPQYGHQEVNMSKPSIQRGLIGS